MLAIMLMYTTMIFPYALGHHVKGKGKVIPITGLCGPEGG